MNGDCASSYLIILLLVTITLLLVTSMHLYFHFTAARYCLLFITVTPLRRLRCAVTRAPRSRSLWLRAVGHRAREQEAKQISHYTSMRAPPS